MITIIILSLLAALILIAAFVARRRRRTERGGDAIPLFSVPSNSTAIGVVRPRFSIRTNT